MSNAPIHDVIASARERLTPTERRIAREVLDDPTLIAFGTVSDLAARIGTSRPTIVRFATKLGFRGYTDLQATARDSVLRQLTSPGERIRAPEDAPSRTGAAIQDAVARVLRALDDAALQRLVSPIVAARRVWILSGETSMAGARVLHSGLSMLRPDVTLVMEHSTGRDLCGAAPGDAAVVLDFARYRRVCVRAARALDERGVEIVAITDGPLSPLASLTTNRCDIPIPGIGPFDSAAPVVVAAELIVARVARELGDAARERIDRLESMWRTAQTFLDNTPRRDRPARAGDTAGSRVTPR